MTPLLEKQFDRLSKKIQKVARGLSTRLSTYLRHLLFPAHLFPIKLITYTTYYLLKFSLTFLISCIKLSFESIVFPFKSLKNFLKSIFVIGAGVYMAASLFVITDYLANQYGQYGKFLCSFGVQEQIKSSVMRVVGGYSEGTGFFISPNQVITSFHVIADEPSPKIIFPDGTFITPERIVGELDADLAVLYTTEQYPSFVLPLPDNIPLVEDEQLIAAGYPLGTSLAGDATLVKGRFINFRQSSQMPIGYIQTDISLVEGMSGGPLVDQCGEVVGINTLGLAGLSLFVTADKAKLLVPGFTDQNITKIEVDPTLSPVAAVEAFYTYLKARRMEDGYALLSSEYLQNTNFEEWTNRFTDVLDVDVISAEPFEENYDTVFLKFQTKNWRNGDVNYHYYEGTWQTVEEDGMYKMLRSKIKEVTDPPWDWFYNYE